MVRIDKEGPLTRRELEEARLSNITLCPEGDTRGIRLRPNYVGHDPYYEGEDNDL